MKVPANDFKRLFGDCRTDIEAAVRRVGESGWFVLGREVAGFESELVACCGHGRAVGCGNGMDAIEIALRACDLPAGAPVLTTPLSAFATGLAIRRAGGEPLYCDVDETGLIDLDTVEACLRERPEVRYVVPVHLYGHLVDVARLDSIASRYDVTVVEDAAQAVGARRDGRWVGSAGRAACYSFYPTKNLGALGDGGALSTDDAQLEQRARALRDYGQSSKYVHDELGLNSRLDELQAAILRQAFLPKLATWTERRREIAKAYLAQIIHPDVTLLPGPDVDGSVWHLFPVLVPAAARDAFVTYLREAGVGAGLHYPTIIPDQKAMRRDGAEPAAFGPLKTAERFAREEVSLPIHPYMSAEEVGHVVQAVNAWDGGPPRGRSS